MMKGTNPEDNTLPRENKSLCRKEPFFGKKASLDSMQNKLIVSSRVGIQNSNNALQTMQISSGFLVVWLHLFSV